MSLNQFNHQDCILLLIYKITMMHLYVVTNLKITDSFLSRHTAKTISPFVPFSLSLPQRIHTFEVNFLSVILSIHFLSLNKMVPAEFLCCFFTTKAISLCALKQNKCKIFMTVSQNRCSNYLLIFNVVKTPMRNLEDCG